jgi:alpha-glucoside transport system substrate-binding protein
VIASAERGVSCMTLRRKFWVLLMAMALLVAGCNTGNGDEEADEGEQEQGGDPIEVAAVWTGAEQRNFEAVLEAFTEETGIDASYRSTGDDIAAFLGTQIEGGSPPDVAMIPQPALVQQLAGDGSLQ